MKRFLQLAVLAVVVAQPALADKGKDKAVPATPASVALMRCDSVAGSAVVVAVTASEQNGVPVQLPVLVGDNCATAAANLFNNKWKLKFVTSGTAVTPAEGASGFVTDYTFVTATSD
jgi:hypothetical protein